jgi:hypothetical protein
MRPIALPRDETCWLKWCDPTGMLPERFPVDPNRTWVVVAGFGPRI